MSKPLAGRFGFMLRSALIIKKMSQRDLCAATGLTDSCVSQYVNGLRSPNLESLVLILAALELPFEYFVMKS